MKNKTWLVGIFLLGAINVYWFWPGHLYFLNDDLLHIPLTDQGHLFQTNSVRPLHELLVRLDLLLWHKNAFGYHLTALLLHALVCIQLFDLCATMQTRWLKIERHLATKAALIAVILFLAYPQSSESVAWILGRTPVLSAVFFMFSIRLFFAKIYTWRVYLTGAICFAAALFTYEQSLLVPVAFLLIAFKEKERLKRRRMYVYALILLIVDAVYILARKLITSEVVGSYEGGNLLAMNWAALVANAFRIFFRLVLNPANRSGFITSAIILLLLILIIVFFGRKWNTNKGAVAFFVAIVVLLIAPVISLGLPVNSFESGRFLYLPSLFFIAGISIWGVAAYAHNNRFRKPLVALLLTLTGYWLVGKYTASRNYTAASDYVKSVENQVQLHFQQTTDTLYIDTLHASIQRLPVFRLGFKTGMHWLSSRIDTSKIVVRNYHDEVMSPKPQ